MMRTPGTPAKLTDKVQIWDGIRYDIVTRKEAMQAVKRGTHQLVEGLSAADLLTRQQLAEAAPAPKRKAYKTRQMKAEA